MKSNDRRKFERALSILTTRSDAADGNNPLNSPIDDRGMTLLQIAVWKDDEGNPVNVDYAKALIHHGAKADAYNHQLRQAPIHLAVTLGSIEHVEILFENENNMADPDVPMETNGQTPLHIAAEKGFEDIVEFLLEKSVRSVNVIDYTEKSPLFLASFKAKNFNIVKLLLKKNADVGCPAPCHGFETINDVILNQFSGFDPQQVEKKELSDVQILQQILFSLKNCSRKNSPSPREFERVLLSIRGKVEVKDLERSLVNGFTLMQHCTINDLDDFVRLLLDSKVDPNWVPPPSSPESNNLNSKQPVLLAAEIGSFKILQRFRKTALSQSEHKVDFSVTTRESSSSALHLVLQRLHPVERPENWRDWNLKYKRSFNALTDDVADNDPIGRSKRGFAEQIRSIVNHQDKQMNTPLHYAVKTWPSNTVVKLMQLGANIGLKNNRGEIPLDKMSKETLSEFLDNYCMTAYYPIADKKVPYSVPNEIVTKDEKEAAVLDFQWNLEKMYVGFNYGFLVSPGSTVNNEDEENGCKKKNNVSEINTVWHLSQSEEHNLLITHPVINSFLWLKWEGMRRVFDRNLRAELFLTFCISWYMFSIYGGTQWNTTPFCQDLNVEWSAGSRSGLWYILFCFFSALQLVWIVADCLRGTTLYSNYLSSESCKKVNPDIFPGKSCGPGWACVIDVILTMLSLIVIWGSSNTLWLAITILLIYSALRELLQFASSLVDSKGTKRLEYFRDGKNYADVGFIILSFVVVFVKKPQFKDYLTFTISLSGDCVGDVAELDPCAIKRCLAAILIVLSWTRIVNTVGKHPHFGNYSIYTSMYWEVFRTFSYYLLTYSVMLVSFGLGFYVMFHKDVKEGPQCLSISSNQGKVGEEKECNACDCPWNFFDTPWMALAKVVGMTVGEIEFSDIPVNEGSGDIAVTFSYLFVIAYIFMILIVFINLLNGLAITDIAKLRDTSAVVCNISKIRIMVQLDSLGNPCLGDGYLVRCCQCFSALFRLLSGSKGDIFDRKLAVPVPEMILTKDANDHGSLPLLQESKKLLQKTKNAEIGKKLEEHRETLR